MSIPLWQRPCIVRVPAGQYGVLDLLLTHKFADSKADAKRILPSLRLDRWTDSPLCVEGSRLWDRAEKVAGLVLDAKPGWTLCCGSWSNRIKFE